MKLYLYGTKLATTQTYQDGHRLPISVVSVESQQITGHRTIEKDGYQAYIVTTGIKAKQKEIRSESLELQAGHQFDLPSILTPGSLVQITGTSKGKGTSGVVKRWNFSGQPETHGQSDRTRRAGSIGRGTTPGRVVPGKHMAGHMGHEAITVKNLTVINFDPATNQLKLSGLVPGSLKSAIKLTVTVN